MYDFSAAALMSYIITGPAPQSSLCTLELSLQQPSLAPMQFCVISKLSHSSLPPSLPPSLPSLTCVHIHSYIIGTQRDEEYRQAIHAPLPPPPPPQGKQEGEGLQQAPTLVLIVCGGMYVRTCAGMSLPLSFLPWGLVCLVCVCTFSCTCMCCCIFPLPLSFLSSCICGVCTYNICIGLPLSLPPSLIFLVLSM